MPEVLTDTVEVPAVVIDETEYTLEDKVDYLIRQVDTIARKIAEFEGNIGPALAAVTNGGIFSMLTGRSKK